jgi:hypothetical protein
MGASVSSALHLAAFSLRSDEVQRVFRSSSSCGRVAAAGGDSSLRFRRPHAAFPEAEEGLWAGVEEVGPAA